MRRPSDLTPRDVDFYYVHRVQDVWAAIHACTRDHEERQNHFTSVCGLASGNVSTIPSEDVYDSVEEALRSDTTPCALCQEAGVFDPDSNI